MNNFRARIPGGVDVMLEPVTFDFKTTNDLINHEYVQRFTSDKNFNYLAMSDNVLMCISDEGKHWWALGYIKNPKAITLPRWEPHDEADELFSIKITEHHFKRSDDFLKATKSRCALDKEHLYKERIFRGENLESLRKEVDKHIEDISYVEKDPFGHVTHSVNCQINGIKRIIPVKTLERIE